MNFERDLQATIDAIMYRSKRDMMRARGQLSQAIDRAQVSHAILRKELAVITAIEELSQSAPGRLARTRRALAIWDATYSVDPVDPLLDELGDLVKAAFAADTADVNAPDRAKLITWSPNPNSTECWLRRRIREDLEKHTS